MTAGSDVLRGVKGWAGAEVSGVTGAELFDRRPLFAFGSKHPPPSFGAWVFVCLVCAALAGVVSAAISIWFFGVRCVLSRAAAIKGLIGLSADEPFFLFPDSNASRAAERASVNARGHSRLQTISPRNLFSSFSVFGTGKTEVTGFIDPGTGSAGISGTGSGPGGGAADCGTREKQQKPLFWLRGFRPEAQSRFCLPPEGNRIH